MTEKTPSIDQRELQRLVLEYQYLRQVLNTISQQLEILNTTRLDLLKTKMTLDGISVANKNAEALVPIGAGVHLYVMLRNVERVLLNIGHRYFMEYDIKKAREYIDKRLKEVDETLKKLQEESANVNKRLTEIAPILQKYLRSSG
ncbi:MAG: prefoldin subunit alpha [Thermoprotei archaeon]|nr:prefoldin subunit alpha [Thermoprotei archaeon]